MAEHQPSQAMNFEREKRPSAKARVLVLSTVHSVTDARIFEKECRALAREGYDVTLLAVGEGSATRYGVKVRTLPKLRSRLRRGLLHPFRAYRLALELKPDVCHLHDPELAPIGFVLKARGFKVVYDVHEDLPAQVVSKYWIPPFLRAPTALFASLLQRAAGRSFDLVVAASPKIASTFPKATVVTVHNYPLLDEAEEVVLAPFGERPLRAVYVGGISKQRAAREMIQAIAAVPAEAELVLAGPLVPASLQEELTDTEGIERTRLLGPIPRSEMWNLLGTARAGLCLLYPTPNNYEALPTKLFEYMAAGVPIVASNFPVLEAIVGKHGCGIVVDPTDAGQVGEAVAYLLTHPDEAEAMGLRGRAAVSNYDWRSEEKVLLHAYEKLLSTSG